MSVAAHPPDRSNRAPAADQGHGAHVHHGRRPRPRPVVAAARRRPGRRGRPAGARDQPRRPRRDPRPDQPSARHRHPGVLARRRVRRRAAAADADGLARGVRRSDPRPASATPTPRSLLIDPDLAPFYEPRRGRSAVGAAARSDARARAAQARMRSSAVGDDLDRLAILQFTSGSTSEPKGVMLPQRVLCSNLDAIDEPRRSTPTKTCSSRGCRCTTTWASSAA